MRVSGAHIHACSVVRVDASATPKSPSRPKQRAHSVRAHSLNDQLSLMYKTRLISFVCTSCPAMMDTRVELCVDFSHANFHYCLEVSIRLHVPHGSDVTNQMRLAHCFSVSAAV